MKNLLISLLLFLCYFNVKSQIVQSSCIAPDSIVSMYNDDADFLTINSYKYNLLYADSFNIPKQYSEPILKALIAVYNAESLPARDTVVSIYNIHTFKTPYLRKFGIMADSLQDWMLNVRNNIIPTGEPLLDSLMIKYEVNIDYYYPFKYMNHTVSMSTKNNYNMENFTSLWQSIPGVIYCYTSGGGGGGNDIYINDSTYTNHIELIYSIGREDCPSGCIFRRYWKFNVYEDCSVEFAGSYNRTDPTSSVGENIKNKISISPNPFRNNISIDGISTPFNYSIYNLYGQIMFQGQSYDNKLDQLDKLPTGLYVLKLQSQNQIATFKIIKE